MQAFRSVSALVAVATLALALPGDPSPRDVLPRDLLPLDVQPLDLLPLDLLPPGHKSVRHELVILPAPALLGRQLVAAPYPGLSGVTAIEPGQPFRFSAKYGTRVFALGAGETAPPRFDGAWSEGRMAAPIPVREIASVSVASPLVRVVTTCRFASLDAGGFRLEVVGEQRFAAGDRPIDAASLAPWWIAIAMIGLVGLVLLHRARGEVR